jgi:FkbM family methyltransferase
MYCRQVYFPSAAFGLRPGDCVVDVGANAGLFSLLAALAGCRVLAIEAQAGFVSEIEALLRAHGVRERVTLAHALVGGATGVLSDERNLQVASHFGGVQPPSVPMADLLAKHGVEDVDFMKVDIEGSEFDLVRPPSDWLCKVTRLAMEVHPDYGDPKELMQAVSSQGLRVEFRDNDLVPVAELPAAGGYLFAVRQPRP